MLIDAFVQRYMDPPCARRGGGAGCARFHPGFGRGLWRWSLGFVPIRKKGKLPFTTVEETYELEYGSAHRERMPTPSSPATGCC